MPPQWLTNMNSSEEKKIGLTNQKPWGAANIRSPCHTVLNKIKSSQKEKGILHICILAHVFIKTLNPALTFHTARYKVLFKFSQKI